MKVLERFKQGGGFRLAKTYFRMGLLSNLLKAGFYVLVKGKSYQSQYSILAKKVKPLLAKEFNSVLVENDKLIKELRPKKELNKENSKYVWFCWLQGMDNAPKVVKSCLESQKKWLKDRIIITITAENYAEYITLPEFIKEKHDKGIIPNAMFSDLIRLELLIRYGGTWIDATVMITGNNYPKEILDCTIFMPQYINHNGTRVGISSWMITATRDNHLLILLREMLLEYWRRYDCVVYYYIFHFFFGMIECKYPNEVKTMPQLNSFLCIELLNHLGEHDKTGKLERFLSKVSIHKLSYRLCEEVVRDEKNVLHDLLRLVSGSNI